MNAYAPQSGDETMMRTEMEIVLASVLSVESFPPLSSVSFVYRLTTPCNQLRANINQPDNRNRIKLEISSVAPKDKPCNLVSLLTPPEANISLGNLEGGHYTVWVNGSKVGEIDA